MNAVCVCRLYDNADKFSKSHETFLYYMQKESLQMTTLYLGFDAFL